MKKTLFCLFFLLLTVSGFSQSMTDGSTISEEEMKLYKIVMQYRASKGLPSIPLSKSLTYVAQVHVRDMYNYYKSGSACNLHSWSSHGNWTYCCYTPDHANAQCMWSKPSELTRYKGNGYEIAYYYSAGATAEDALSGWKSSPGHNATIINAGMWHDKWNAIGIGIYKYYAVIWFGNEIDPDQTPVRVQYASSSSSSLPASQSIVQPVVQTQANPFATPSATPSTTPSTTPSAAPSATTAVTTTATITSLTSTNNDATINKTTTTNQAAIATKSTTTNNVTTKDKSTTTYQKPRHKFYDYSGTKFLSVINANYTYDITDNRHMVSLGILGYRYKMFGFSLLDFEMGVAPFSESFGWKPTLELYIPISKSFSVNVHAGTSVDITYLGQYLLKNYTYDEKNFYVTGVVGLSLYHSGCKNVPFKVFGEYRYPFIGTFQSKGFYVGVQLTVGVLLD